jgi:hypothetical protein
VNKSLFVIAVAVTAFSVAFAVSDHRARVRVQEELALANKELKILRADTASMQDSLEGDVRAMDSCIQDQELLRQRLDVCERLDLSEVGGEACFSGARLLQLKNMLETLQICMAGVEKMASHRAKESR